MHARMVSMLQQHQTLQTYRQLHGSTQQGTAKLAGKALVTSNKVTRFEPPAQLHPSGSEPSASMIPLHSTLCTCTHRKMYTTETPPSTFSFLERHHSEAATAAAAKQRQQRLSSTASAAAFEPKHHCSTTVAPLQHCCRARAG